MPLSQHEHKHPAYTYFIAGNEPLSEKVDSLREFLLKYKETDEFEEKKDGSNYWHNMIVSVRGKNTPTLCIALPRDHANAEQDAALDKTWLDTLELSCKLEDRWNGTAYTVFKRRSLECKQMVLEQFLKKYDNTTFEIEAAYNENSAFRIVATGYDYKPELIIHYHPEKSNEHSELNKLVPVS